MPMPKRNPRPMTKPRKCCEFCGCPISLSTGRCPREWGHPYEPSLEEIAAMCAEFRAARGVPATPGDVPPYERQSYATRPNRRLSTVKLT